MPAWRCSASSKEIDQTQMEWLIDINFWGVVRATRAFLPQLSRQREAHIVNLSSIFGIVAPPGQTAYSAAKFAACGFSESLRHELQTADSPVKLTVVHPGGVATNIARNSKSGMGVTDNARRAELIERFDTVAKTSPQAAALRIIAGIEKNAPRVLIGNDARFMDLLQRLLPGTYWSVLSRSLAKPEKNGEIGLPSFRDAVRQHQARNDVGLLTLPSHQLIGEIRDGLAVDGGMVPLAHRLEIGDALLIGWAHLEAVGVQEIGGGGEHVGHAVPEIDAAVAVEIDAVFDIGRRQKLRLSDFAGKGADQIPQRKVAALEDLQRREQFALEQFGAAAIMRHRGQRADHGQLAHVALAEIRRQPQIATRICRGTPNFASIRENSAA